MLKDLTPQKKLNYSLTDLCSQMFNHFWILISWAFGTYLLPAHSVMFIMVFMVLIDFFTGIWKSIKVFGVSSISSKKIGCTIEKLMMYMIGIIASFVLENHIGLKVVNVMWIFGTLVITREYISIVENIEMITGARIVKTMRLHIHKLFPEPKEKTND